ncbi:MAG TPA: FkbM family methyltransferase [Acidimicrobiales bacterium]|nr:FkbM family methyltransferase [Acidimicrobiales bacterium]
MDTEVQPVTAARGGRGQLVIRDETSDLSLALATLSNHWATGDDEYGLADLHIEGVFVDVGAHIGVVSLAVLLDNPEATAILVEPIPENMALARETMALNDLTSRVTFVEAAVGTKTVRYGTDLDDRFVGNLGYNDGPTITTEKVTLAQLVKMAGGRIAALKTDCEGGEWSLLDSRSVGKVERIFGEWHGHDHDFSGPERLHRLLDVTHEVTVLSDDGGVGLFRAVAR